MVFFPTIHLKFPIGKVVMRIILAQHECSITVTKDHNSNITSSLHDIIGVLFTPFQIKKVGQSDPGGSDEIFCCDQGEVL